VGQPSYGERQECSADLTEGAAVDSHADDDVRMPEGGPEDELATSSNACLSMSLREAQQVEAALSKQPAVVPQLMAVLRRFGSDHEVERQGSQAGR
jgi:hypothetical protein